MSAMSQQWNPSLWLGQKARMRLAKLLVYVLLVLLVWQVARLLLLILSGPSVPPASIPPLPEWRSETVTPSQGLAQWHLFGEAQQGFDLSAFAQLPDTPLKLTLRGIVAESHQAIGAESAGEEGHEGYALIADEHGAEDVYRRGDALPGGAEVVSIQPEQVILLRNGKRETLRLPNARGNTGDSSGVAGGNQPGIKTINIVGSNRSSAQNQNQAVRNLPGIRAPQRPVNVTTAVPQLSGLRMNASALASAIQVAPVSGGGFRVFPGRNAQVFQQLGLQANDVVTQVNGKPLNSQADAMAIFQQVQSGKSLTLTVKRGNRDVVLRPDLNTLLSNQP